MTESVRVRRRLQLPEERASEWLLESRCVTEDEWRCGTPRDGAAAFTSAAACLSSLERQVFIPPLPPRISGRTRDRPGTGATTSPDPGTNADRCERDPIVQPRLAAEYQRAITGAELVILDGAGHVPMSDKPDDFAAAVLDFLPRSS